MKFRRLLGVTLLAVGIGCLVWAFAFGHDSARSAAVTSFAASAVCLSRCRRLSEEG